MARYEDYIQEESESHEQVRDPQGRFTKQDSLIEEIKDARVQQETREEQSSAIPERFQGKSAEEIANSYIELEKLSSRQANDLGAMRKQVDQLLELQTSLSTPQPEQSTPAKPVTMDDLYDDPEAVIRRVVGEALGDQSKRVDSLEQTLTETTQATAMEKFESKHKDYRQIGESPEFVNWVLETPYRQRLGLAAQGGDLEAADDLLSMWKDQNNIAAQQAEDTRQQQLRAASLESSERSGTVQTSGDTFSRSKLMELKIAAKRGDTAAAQWLASNEDAIRMAYAEHRVVD